MPLLPDQFTASGTGMEIDQTQHKALQQRTVLVPQLRILHPQGTIFGGKPLKVANTGCGPG